MSSGYKKAEATAKHVFAILDCELFLPCGRPMRCQLSGPRSKSRARLLLLVLLTLIGAHIGAEYHVRAGATHAIVCAVSIEPKFIAIGGCWGDPPIRLQGSEHFAHEELIANDSAIAACLANYPELKDLSSFSSVSSDQIAAEISRNTTIRKDRESSFIYELNYHSRNTADGVKILKCLVETYRTSLDVKTKEKLDAENAQFVIEHGLESNEAMSFRKLHEYSQGYRFAILRTQRDTRFATAQMFRSTLAGAAIAFFVTAALLAFTKRKAIQTTDKDCLHA